MAKNSVTGLFDLSSSQITINAHQVLLSKVTDLNR